MGGARREANRKMDYKVLDGHLYWPIATTCKVSGLLLSLTTRLVSPLFHAKFDNNFETVIGNQSSPKSMWQIVAGFEVEPPGLICLNLHSHSAAKSMHIPTTELNEVITRTRKTELPIDMINDEMSDADADTSDSDDESNKQNQNHDIIQ